MSASFFRRLGHVALTAVFAFGSITPVAGAAEARTTDASVEGGRKLALLIGVGDYDLLPAPGDGVTGPADLKGPRHDIARMVRATRDLGVQAPDLVVLSDALDPAETDRVPDGRPTRQLIIDRLTKLATKARAGDQVLIYFSGHGSQAPDSATAGILDEADGLDEIILPADIGAWDDAVGAVQNAITDDEIGAAVDAIRRRGAYVWLVVDACHSGTALRGGPLSVGSEVEVKAVPTSLLRIPRAALDAARTAGARLAGRGGFEPGSVDRAAIGMGGVTAFYAASSSEAAIATTFQVEGQQTPSLGILTFALTQALASGRTQTYRDLALRVQAIFQTPGLRAPQPAFEGDFDRAIMGLDVVPPHEWRVRRDDKGQLMVDGGWLDGLRPGAILAVRYAATSSDPIAYLEVEKAAATSATLKPRAHQGLADTAAAQISKYHVFAGTQVAAGVPFVLRIGRPPANPNPSAVDTLLQNALELIAADPTRVSGARLELVPPGNEADVYLRSGADRVWFADQADGFDRGRRQPPALVVGGATRLDDFATDLAGRLRNFARAQALMGVMGELELGPGREGVQVTYFVQPAPRSGPARSEREPCPAMPSPPFTPPSTAKPLAAYLAEQQGLPRLRNCDLVYVRVENGGPKPVDMTPLYFGRDASVAYLESGKVDGIRILPGRSRTFIFQAQTFDIATGTPLPLGPEQLAIIVTPQPDENVPPLSYAYLAQAVAPQTRAGSSRRGSLEQLLDEAGYAVGGTRGGSVGGEASAVFRTEWIVSE